jgi:hypothetical protein
MGPWSDEISAPVKSTLVLSLPPSPPRFFLYCADTARKKVANCKPEWKPSPVPDHGQDPDVELLASQLWKIKFCYVIQLDYGILLW